ncbi:immunity 49 family protein [Nocardia sp. NPDC004722]
MNAIARHSIDEELVIAALTDIDERVRQAWISLRYDALSLKSLRAICEALLDHVGARSLEDPELTDVHARLALRTAAECSIGVLSLGVFPSGDFEVRLPSIRQELNSRDISLGDAVDEAPTARTWLDTFGLCLISGIIWEWERVLGLSLRDDYAPQLHAGLPYSRLQSQSDPADLAEMDALCLYLTEATGHLPSDWPEQVVRKPTTEERLEALRRLDLHHPLTPDQHLLRALLEDNQSRFEQTLAQYLTDYRAALPDHAQPRTLLPQQPIALAALAIQTHGWQLGLVSHYLPPALLKSPPIG